MTLPLLVIWQLLKCCTRNVLLHTQCPVAHQMSCCTPNVLLHTKCPIAHPMSCCTPNVLLHTQCHVAHVMSYCTPNVLLHNKCPIAHQMSCCTPNVLLHTRCPENSWSAIRYHKSTLLLSHLKMAGSSGTNLFDRASFLQISLWRWWKQRFLA